MHIGMFIHLFVFVCLYVSFYFIHNNVCTFNTSVLLIQFVLLFVSRMYMCVCVCTDTPRMVGHKRWFECGFLFFIWGISFEIGLHTRRSAQNGSALREFKSQLRLRLFMASQQLQPTSAIKSASQASQQVSRAPQCFEFFPLTFFGI